MDGLLDELENLEHVRNVKEIGKHEVMDLSALLINGKVMSVGKVPPKAKSAQWLQEASTGQ